MDAERIDEIARRCGATVMGSSDDVRDLHYIMNAAELVRFIEAVTAVPPCPVPPPPQK